MKEKDKEILYQAFPNWRWGKGNEKSQEGKGYETVRKKPHSIEKYINYKLKSNVTESLMRKVDWWEEDGCVEGKW